MSALLASSQISGVKKVIIFLRKAITSSGMATSVLGLLSIKEATTHFLLKMLDWAELGLLSGTAKVPGRLAGNDAGGGSLRFLPEDCPAAVVDLVAQGGT